MSKKNVEDYSKIESSGGVKHIVDDDGKGWFCYCGGDAKATKNKNACCTPEGNSDFERVG